MSTLRRATGFATSLLLLGACQPREVEVAPPPAVAEAPARPAPAAAVVAPVEVQFERALPITAEDVGDLLVARGTVVGKPGPNGFFLRTDRNRVVFVESTEPVALGRQVRVVGPLQAAEVPVFDGWQRDLLGNLEADWDLLRLYYIRASSVAAVP